MKFDFIVVGSGLAGLSFALKASQLGQVALLSKEELLHTNTWRAQGGVASVTSATDSFDKHIADTLSAGDGLCDLSAVKRTVELGPQMIRELIELGVLFDSKNNELLLGQEGGHSQRRILHIDDTTGESIHKVLIELARKNQNIKIFENVFAYELLSENNSCSGVLAFDSNHLYRFIAPKTVLATGGAGKAFLYTSNWSGATGDGLAMAYKAGAELSNLEFTQFHPTCLYNPAARNFLISEALRGEGGRLINSKNEAFMANYHELKDLAPRDVVARAIDLEMKSLGSECVWLDMSYLNNPDLKTRFPTIYSRCLQYGIDFLKTPIPVVPAAHYLCGGITVDEYSRTSIQNLYALGETANTGLHGANRLASNSLLECLVTAELAFQDCQKEANSDKSSASIQEAFVTPKTVSDESKFMVSTLWTELRLMMWNRMGIVRSDTLINGALENIDLMSKEAQALKTKDPEIYRFAPFHELTNILTISNLMILSAKDRKESRGCHFNTNHALKNKDAFVSRISLNKNVTYTPIEEFF